MKRWLIVVFLGLVLLPLTILQAQEDNGCDLDLVDETSRLLEAQAAANAGDAAGAAAIIAEVQAALDALLTACGGAAELLPAMLEFPDGLLRVRYPADWSQVSPISGAYIIGNNADALKIIAESNLGDDIPAGSQVVIAIYGNAQTLFDAGDFAAFRTRIEEDGLSSAARFINPQPVTINDFPGYRYTLESEVLQGAAYAIDLQVSNRVAFFVALTPPGEYPAMEPLFELVVNSIDYGLDAPGTVEAPTNLIPNTGVSLNEITYTQVQSLATLSESLGLPEDFIDVRSAVLAPDGTRIGWFERGDTGQLCVVALSDGTYECIDFPEDFGNSPSYLLWSPDSRYLALTQEWARTLSEPDLWVLDTTTRSLTNLTDDNIRQIPLGDSVDEGESTGPLWIEQLYTWGPDDNLYFVRQERPDIRNRDVSSTQLYRLPPTGGTPEPIRDFSGLFDWFSIYEFELRELSGSLAVSPDATQIAFIVREPRPDSEDNGLWVMSLSGEDAPRQVIAMPELRMGLPADQEPGPLFPTSLAWNADQSGLWLYATDPAGGSGAVNALLYHYQLADGSLTPLTDFRAVSAADLFEIDPQTDRAASYFVPRGAALAPDANAVMTFHLDTVQRGTASLWAYAVRDDGVEQGQLLEFEWDGFRPMQSVSVAQDGKVLIWGMLLSPG
jgi:hypothetical protein